MNHWLIEKAGLLIIMNDFCIFQVDMHFMNISHNKGLGLDILSLNLQGTTSPSGTYSNKKYTV